MSTFRSRAIAYVRVEPTRRGPLFCGLVVGSVVSLLLEGEALGDLRAAAAPS